MLASHQEERKNKLASERGPTKVNSCEADPKIVQPKEEINATHQILAEIREMKADISNLRQRVDGSERTREFSDSGVARR